MQYLHHVLSSLSFPILRCPRGRLRLRIFRHERSILPPKPCTGTRQPWTTVRTSSYSRHPRASMAPLTSPPHPSPLPGRTRPPPPPPLLPHTLGRPRCRRRSPLWAARLHHDGVGVVQEQGLVLVRAPVWARRRVRFHPLAQVPWEEEEEVVVVVVGLETTLRPGGSARYQRDRRRWTSSGSSYLASS